MLRGGVTCFADTYLFPEAAHEAAHDAGMRVALGLMVADVPTAYASDPADYLRKGLALRDRLGEHPLVSFCFAPQAVPEAALRQIATLAAELDLPVVMQEPVERLHRLGMLGPGLIAAQALRLQPEEIQLLARYGCSVVLCPSSDLTTGSAPIEALRKAGVNICLGTGSPVRNQRFDLLGEMRIAALFGRITARDALRAATLGGARALGLGAHVGSIEAGKRADLVAIEVRGPCHDPVSYVVLAAGPEHVSHVWVDGELRNRLAYTISA